MIYAIKAVGTEYIKFGHAGHVGKRLTELQCASPLDLEIVALAKWPNEAEKSIHHVLASHRHKGEWFKDSEPTQSIINLMAQDDRGLQKLRKMVETERGSAPRPFLACAREGQPESQILPAYQVAAINAWAAVMAENGRAAQKAEKP